MITRRRLCEIIAAVALAVALTCVVCGLVYYHRLNSELARALTPPGDLDRVMALVRRGASVNQRGRGPDGRTPLWVAAHYDDSRAVGELLDRGARIDAEGVYGWTPLMIAAFMGNDGAARVLISRGADVSRRNVDGFTPLACAEAYSMRSTIALLKSAGAK